MEFEQNDVVRTRVPLRATNGSVVAGGSVGTVTAVGIELEGGWIDGVEVLFSGLLESKVRVRCTANKLTKIGNYLLPEEYQFSPESHSHITEGETVERKFKKDDRVVIKHPSRQGQHGRIFGVLAGGYTVKIDGFEMLGGNYYLEKDLEFEDFTRSTEPQLNDYVLVINDENDHYGKTGWVEHIETAPHVTMVPFLVKFKDMDAAAVFRANELKVLGSAKQQDREKAAEEPTIKPEDRPEELKKFRGTDPLAQAVALVNALYYEGKLPAGDVYIVWFCAALQNWKALVSTNVKDNMYYEVTHNGDKKETYVDPYVKVRNRHFRIPDEYLED